MACRCPHCSLTRRIRVLPEGGSAGRAWKNRGSEQHVHAQHARRTIHCLRDSKWPDDRPLGRGLRRGRTPVVSLIRARHPRSWSVRRSTFVARRSGGGRRARGVGASQACRCVRAWLSHCSRFSVSCTCQKRPAKIRNTFAALILASGKRRTRRAARPRWPPSPPIGMRIRAAKPLAALASSCDTAGPPLLCNQPTRSWRSKPPGARSADSPTPGGAVRARASRRRPGPARAGAPPAACRRRAVGPV